jgi:hypothetical protein
MPHVSIARIVWTLAIVLVSGFALWRGARAERVIALSNLGAWGASLLLENRHNWLDPQWGVLLVDLAFLAVLLAFALRNAANWLLFAAAFQLLSVVTHMAIMVDGGVRARAYFQGLAIWSYLVLISLGVGVWVRWRQDQAGVAAIAPARR